MAHHLDMSQSTHENAPSKSTYIYKAPICETHLNKTCTAETLWLWSSGSEPWKTYAESNDAWSMADTTWFLPRTSTYLSIYFPDQISLCMQLV